MPIFGGEFMPGDCDPILGRFSVPREPYWKVNICF